MLFWRETDNKYFGKYFVFAQDELDYLDALEVEWSKAQRRLKLYQLLEIFPEAEKCVLKTIKQKITALKDHSDKLLKIKRSHQNFIFVDPQNKELYKLWIEDIEKDQKEINREIKRLVYLRIFTIRAKEKPLLSEKSLSDLDIQSSKEIPIENFYDGKLQPSGRGRLVGACEFHEDKTPSFTIYKDQNSWFCFSCTAGGDVIDYVKKKYNLNFIEAVKKLLHR